MHATTALEDKSRVSFGKAILMIVGEIRRIA